MSLHRKKPVVIEAVQFIGIRQGVLAFKEGPDWLTEAINKPAKETGAVFRNGDGAYIHTLEGEHRANPGDWIIRGVKGELYPCKPDIFDATYEAAE